MNSDKLACLNALHGLTYPAELCVPFAPIMEDTSLDRQTVRRHVRALARDGLAEFHKGLFNDDGQPAGAGYCITKAGMSLIEEKAGAP